METTFRIFRARKIAPTDLNQTNSIVTLRKQLGSRNEHFRLKRAILIVIVKNFSADCLT